MLMNSRIKSSGQCSWDQISPAVSILLSTNDGVAESNGAILPAY